MVCVGASTERVLRGWLAADGSQPGTLLLGVKPVDFSIAARTPLPRPSCRYDMVTAWLMCFDRACTYGKDHKHVPGRDDADEFREAEWHFLLMDLACNFLNKGAPLVFEHQVYARKSKAGLWRAVRKLVNIYVEEKVEDSRGHSSNPATVLRLIRRPNATTHCTAHT
jgi:hypothetical protein